MEERLLLPKTSAFSQQSQAARPTPWSPLRHTTFRSLWLASVFSNIGTWIQATATAWLMTSLTASPLMVSLVQTASSLPIFLLVLPAGALADMFDRRRLILCTQMWMLAAAASLGVLTATGHIHPWSLLAFTTLLALGAALNAPAWQSIVPELVEQHEIPSAVALNSAGFNVARSIGPAVGGLIVGIYGVDTAYLLNALSYMGVLWVLYRWEGTPAPKEKTQRNIWKAMKAGFLFMKDTSPLRRLMCSAASFAVSASALMALLPLLAKLYLQTDAVGFGILLASFGLGAVLGALFLPVVRSNLPMEQMNLAASVLFATTLPILAHFHHFPAACACLIVAGMSWLMFLASPNSTVQITVPSHLRGRGMSVYMFIVFGGMALGSVFWGSVAKAVGVSWAFNLAAAALLLSSLLIQIFAVLFPSESP